MTAIASTTSSSSTSGDTTDWFARVLAIISIVITVISFAIQRRGKTWQGRYNRTKDLRPPFEEVREVISSIEQVPGNADLLWTISKLDQLSELRKACERFPDRRSRRRLKAMVEALDQLRGGSQPTSDETNTAPLSSRRLAALKRAASEADEISKRLDKIERKGATGG